MSLSHVIASSLIIDYKVESPLHNTNTQSMPGITDIRMRKKLNKGFSYPLGFQWCPMCKREHSTGDQNDQEHGDDGVDGDDGDYSEDSDDGEDSDDRLEGTIIEVLPFAML